LLIFVENFEYFVCETMIRSRPGGGPFARSRCPFDDEGEECERPFCPFFHPFSGGRRFRIYY